MAPSATSLLTAALGGKRESAQSSHSAHTSSKATSVKSLRHELKLIGQRIREAREAADLTQHQLGKALGVSNKTISAIELANVEPSTTQLMAIARTLGKPVGYLVGETLPSTHKQLQDIEQQLASLRSILKSHA